MSEIDRPGTFYLGKAYDMSAKKVLDQPILYDPRDLTTHAVCVGMTGSGKSGLCTIILEEAALNGVPSIIIDPKGDITNLLLTFPDLRPEDFEPWVNPDDARRKGLSVQDYAASTAKSWAAGLAQWGEGPDRIRRLKAAADFTIYTPGSDAGQAVSILDSMRAPTLDWDDNEDALRERISSTVSALLGLVGINADPLKSREHILLSNIFEYAWRQKQDLDIANLIQLIQQPPMHKLGVFDVNTFFPQNDRFGLAMTFNNILAAPSFENWIEGQSLDVEQILYMPEGKPRASVFYIAHLDDAQRMFFVTLLLEQVITWMRAQSGTTSLRGLVYFDELYGYFPPYPANPPSKAPLMTLLKQARAFGLGLVLTTQNPMDLDYKGLTNAGTWFIGKLQTDRDKMRVMEGLEGALSEAGSAADKADLDRTITALDSRVFLLHNVHAGAPQIFMTRWAMSYLRGPLTRQQIRSLRLGRVGQAAPATQRAEAASVAAPGATPAAPPVAAKEQAPSGASTVMPQVDPAIPVYFLAPETTAQQAIRKQAERDRLFSLTPSQVDLMYEPKVLALAQVGFENKTRNIYHHQEFGYLADPAADPDLIPWDESEVEINRDELDTKPDREAVFADLPEGLGQAQALKAIGVALADYLYRQKSLTLWRNVKLGLYSEVGESKEDFDKRAKEALSKLRDQQAAKVKDSYQAKIDRAEEKLKRAERELAQDEAEYKARKRDQVLNIGESVFGVLTGRKASRALSSASQKARMASQSAGDVKESEQNIADLEKEIADLKQKLLDDLADLDIQMAGILDQVEEFPIKPRRTDVKIDVLGIGWVPRWRVTGNDSRGQSANATLSAFKGV